MASAVPATEVLPAATPYSVRRYVAFTVCEVGELYLDRNGERTIYPPNTYTMNEDARAKVAAATSLKDALAAALMFGSVGHKDSLVISETDDRGFRLHVYRIKRKSTPRYTWKDNARGYERSHDLYADPVCVIDGGVLGL